MDSKYILEQNHGVVCIKLSEKFNSSTMWRRETIAKVERKQVTVTEYDSDKKTRTYVLLPSEMALLIEAWQELEDFWEKKPLPHRHVLLSCGCIVDWDQKDEYGEGCHDLPHPQDYARRCIWCPDHEEASIHRYAPSEFEQDFHLPHRHILLSCGCVIVWEKMEAPMQETYMDCLKHDRTCHITILRFNGSDFIGSRASVGQE